MQASAAPWPALTKPHLVIIFSVALVIHQSAGTNPSSKEERSFGIVDPLCVSRAAKLHIQLCVSISCLKAYHTQIGSFPVFVPLSRARRRSRRDATRADTSSSQRTCANETRLVFGLASPRDAARRRPRKALLLTGACSCAAGDGALATYCTMPTKSRGRLS